MIDPPLGPLDDEPDEVVAAVRKLKHYDDFENFCGEIDGMMSLITPMKEGFAAEGDPALAFLCCLMSDMALMLVHTRAQIEMQKGDLEEQDPADWWRNREIDEEEDE